MLERLHYHVLHELHFSPYIIRVIKPDRLRRTGHVARMSGKQDLYKVLSPDTEANASLGRQMFYRKNNIKTDLQ